MGTKRSAYTSYLQIVTKEQLPSVIQMARCAHDDSRMSHIPFHEGKVTALFNKVLNDSKRHAIFLAHRQKKPVGMAYLSVGEYHIGTGILITTVHNINVIRSVRSSLSGGKVFLGLMRGVETWAQARGSSEIFLHFTSGEEPELAKRLMNRIGYAQIGGSFSKRNKH